jgi:shikimate kinase
MKPVPDIALPEHTVAMPDAAALIAALGARSVVLVGMMGSGKSSIGRRLAARFGTTFVDADGEIEEAAGMTIAEVFDKHGEPYFRAGEARVIARLLDHRPQVLATGGGAFMNPETRKLIKAQAVSVWLKTDLDVLAKRVSRKNTLPLIADRDPMEVLTAQAQARYPIYGEADLVVETGDAPHHTTVDQVIQALSAFHEAHAQ